MSRPLIVAVVVAILATSALAEAQPCPVPTPPIALVVSVTGNSVTLSWEAAGTPTSYVLEVGSVHGASNLFYADIGWTVSIAGTAPDGTYSAHVRARNACGVSGASNDVVFVVGRTGSRAVRLLYVIPQDRTFRWDYAVAIEHAFAHLQAWFRAQLSGRTFSLFTTYPEVCYLPQPAAYYAHETWSKVLDDVQACAPVSYGPSAYTWVLFVDVVHACRAPGRLGVANYGLTMLPRQDLDGLIGARYVDDCGVEYRLPSARYIGGAGHELGHTLGLGHPPGCDAGLPTCDHDALMWAGYASYPHAYLRADEKQVLLASPFIR